MIPRGSPSVQSSRTVFALQTAAQGTSGPCRQRQSTPSCLRHRKSYRGRGVRSWLRGGRWYVRGESCTRDFTYLPSSRSPSPSLQLYPVPSKRSRALQCVQRAFRQGIESAAVQRAPSRRRPEFHSHTQTARSKVRRHKEHQRASECEAGGRAMVVVREEDGGDEQRGQAGARRRSCKRPLRTPGWPSLVRTS